MGSVDLNNGLDNTLFHPLHAIKFLIKDPAGLLRINSLEIIILPLNVHHNGQGTLGMSALFR